MFIGINMGRTLEDLWKDEVRKEFDNKGYVDEADLHQLIYLKCTIRDAMRLHSPVPFYNS